MSVIDTRADGRRAAERNAAERRKKLILVGLSVVLVAVLAFELPKLMKGSSSPSSTASTPVATAATPVVAGNASLAMASSAAKRARAIRRMTPKDPFVPLIRADAATSSSSAAATTAPAPTARPTIGFTASATSVPLPQATPNPAVTRLAHVKPAHVKPAAPTAAVIRTNGQRRVVGLSQEFSIGDAHFRLVSVTRKAMRIKVVGGLFAGAKQTITVRKGHPVKLANTATGVEYGLVFRAGTTEAPTVIPPPTATPQVTTNKQSSTQPTATTTSGS